MNNLFLLWRLRFISTNPGQVYSIDTDAVFPYKPPGNNVYGIGGNKSKNNQISSKLFKRKKIKP